ncbi:MAG: SGNH/GDSL hydrolase family protein [Actinobacteria bacterium]|nr:SGNH/GDSL hydrolase family protein [Actinomycetota bacterium]
MLYTRLITCGDSFTEGMCDEIINGQYRGWADRVADVMATQSPNFTYANLAVRGKLVHQVAADQVPIALKYVTGPETVVFFHAGANDVLRPKYDPGQVLPLYADTVRKIAASGATVFLFTVLERTDAKGKAAELWESRFRGFNENVRTVAHEVGAILADANEDGMLKDRRFLAFDRLHLNALGQYRVAQAILEKLDMPFSPDWRDPLPPKKPDPLFLRLMTNSLWLFGFVLPWMWRRVRGKSSGDGRKSKQSEPVSWLPTR